MKSISDTYAELISLTQLYLLREHSLKEIKIVDPTIIDFFKIREKKTQTASTSKNIQQPTLNSTLKPNPTSTPTPSQSIRQHPNAPHTMTSRVSQQLPQSNSSPLVSNAAHTESLPLQSEVATPSPQTSLPIQPQTPESPPSLQTPPSSQNKEVKRKEFALEPLVAPPPQDHREWWDVSRSLFPQWNLHTSIPSDEIALKNKNAWLRKQEISPVVILSFQDNEQQLTFLKNIAQAITLRLAPAQVISATRIEKENGWENILNSTQLSLMIASDYGLYLHPKLRQFHREVPSQAKHFLNQTPLLLLSDLNLYLKDPQLKPLLWRAICNEFATSQSHPPIENCPA